MGYRIARADEQRTVLLPTPALSGISWLLLSLAAPSGLAGAIAIALGDRSELGFALTGFGLMGAGGFSALRRWAEVWPVRLEFDNLKGLFTAFGRGCESFSIPYGELEGFRAYSDAENTGTVYLLAKDGSVWDLVSPGWRSRRRLEAVLAALRARVSLGQAGAPPGQGVPGLVKAESAGAPPDQGVPPWVRKESVGAATLYAWRDVVDLRMLAAGGMVAAGLALAAAGALSANLSLAVLLGLGLLAGAMVWGVHLARRSGRELRVLAVGAERLRFGTAAALEGVERERWTVRRELPMAKLAGVDYSFDTVFSRVHLISLLDPESGEVLRQRRAGSPWTMDLAALIRAHRRLFAIPFLGRSVPDLARLARDLRRTADELRSARPAGEAAVRAGGAP